MKPVFTTFVSFDVLQKAVCSRGHSSDQVYELLTDPPNTDVYL